MILLTGGSGLLGRHLRKHIDCYAPSSAEFDILHPELPSGVSMIVHSAAYTDVARAEVEREDAYGLNVIGTLNMALYGLPLVYISTAYCFDGARGNYCEQDEPNPLNVYSRTKHLGERMARRAPRWLIVRTLFKPRPFEHERAVTDQWSSGDYVDVIAPMIADAVKLFRDGAMDGLIHIGTERKSTYDLAMRSRIVKPITRKEVAVNLPRDVSLDCSKWNLIRKNHQAQIRAA